MTILTDADVEQASLAWLPGLGWAAAHGPDIAPDAPHSDRIAREPTLNSTSK